MRGESREKEGNVGEKEREQWPVGNRDREGRTRAVWRCGRVRREMREAVPSRGQGRALVDVDVSEWGGEGAQRPPECPLGPRGRQTVAAEPPISETGAGRRQERGGVRATEPTRLLQRVPWA